MKANASAIWKICNCLTTLLPPLFGNQVNSPADNLSDDIEENNADTDNAIL